MPEPTLTAFQNRYRSPQKRHLTSQTGVESQCSGETVAGDNRRVAASTGSFDIKMGLGKVTVNHKTWFTVQMDIPIIERRINAFLPQPKGRV